MYKVKKEHKKVKHKDPLYCNRVTSLKYTICQIYPYAVSSATIKKMCTTARSTSFSFPLIRNKLLTLTKNL